METVIGVPVRIIRYPLESSFKEWKRVLSPLPDVRAYRS